VVSFPVEEDTNQGSNPGGGKKKIPLLATQKIMAGHRPVAPVVGLGPPTRGYLQWSLTPWVVVGLGYGADL